LARQNIAAIAIGDPDQPTSYKKALENPADRMEISLAYIRVCDAAEEVARALETEDES